MTGQQFAIVIRPFAKILLFMIVSDKRDPPIAGRCPRGHNGRTNVMVRYPVRMRAVRLLLT
jgi:hypothetical protein